MRLVRVSDKVSACETEITDRNWTVLTDSTGITSNDVTIYDGEVLVLENGKVFAYTSLDTKKPFYTSDSFPSCFFTSICAAYGKLFLVSEEGRLFGCGKTTRGECGIVSPDPVSSLREIELVTPVAVCPHGVSVTRAESLKIKRVQTTLSEVCVIDFNGLLWKYGDGYLEFDSLGRVQVRPLPLASRRKAVQLCAGRKHFACLVVPTVDAENDTSFDNSPTFRTGKWNKCEKCREENELRLSTLMHKADQDNKSQLSFDPDEEELTKKAPALAQDFGLHRKSDHNPTKCQTLPMCGPPSLTRNLFTRESRRTLFSEFEMTELKSTSSWAEFDKNSTFVSLQNLPDAYYKQDTSTERSSTNSTIYSDKSLNLGKNLSSLSQIDLNLLPEIWTWGANQSGQLGHGDFIMRREPFKIVDFLNIYCIKIAAGDDHTLALTSAGELYIWGSNSVGQVKQTDTSPITKPTLFKIGSHSFILDAFADGRQTGVIVGGIADTVGLLLFGRGTETPRVISIPKKFGWPGWLVIADENIIIGTFGLASETEEYFPVMFAIFKYAKYVQKICQLCQKMHERSHIVNNFILSNLLNKLTLSSTEYATHMFRIAGIIRNNLCNTGSLSIGAVLQSDEAKCFLNALYLIHANFVECLAYGCFAEVDIGEMLGEEVDKFCLSYDVEGDSQEIRLQKLFQLAFSCPCKLPDLESSGDVSAEWKVCWTRAKYNFEHFSAIGVNTYRFWNHSPEHARWLKQPGRLLLWLAENNQWQQQITGVKNVFIKSVWATLRHGWLIVAVFNDAVALIEKRDVIVLNFPLVWTEVSEEGNGCSVRVFGPENEFHIRFSDIDFKNKFMDAMRQWRHFDERYVRNNAIERCTGLPARRRGYYKYSSQHQSFKNCTYDGCWLFGKPHGKGYMLFPDSREYRGHFADGRLEGFGEMSIPVETDKNSYIYTTCLGNKTNTVVKAADVFTGFWHNGLLNGLAHIRFANDDTYEGYMQNGVRHGYGLLNTSKDGEMETYFGGWRLGMRSGYGVSTSNRERYLGMWWNDLRHGRGALVSIEGTFQEGQFDNGRLVHGRLVIPSADSDFEVSYEGDFEKAGIVSGKGVLYLNRFDTVEGQMSGNIISGDVKITNAIYSRRNAVVDMTTMLASFSLKDDMPSVGKWAVEADLKWKELFESFLIIDLNVPIELASAPDASEIADNSFRVTLWDSLASTMAKIRLGMNKEEIKITFDTDLEKIPQHTLEWSSAYYEMVRKYWSLALKHKFHPIRRLVFGLIEVFVSSYGAIGTHRAVCGQAVRELHSIHSRIYAVMRLLFGSLPPTCEMFTPVPLCLDHHCASSRNPELDSYFDERMSLNQGIDFPALLLSPACNFIIETFFSECYAVIFTLYSVNCIDLDRRYWERVVYLNAFTDVKLLAYLEINRDLWPIDIENADDLDTPLIRATARKQFYKSAIQTLQQISSHFNPTSKLAVLADTFKEIGTVSF